MDTFEEARKKKAIATLKGGFGREILLAAAHYVSAIFWAPLPLDAQIELNHGSIFFLECGGPLLAVTADHVYAEYWRRKQREPNLICQIDNLPFIPEERLIDRDQDLDIATFHIKQEEIEQIGKWTYTRNKSQWPPTPPELGKGVFFAGFPRSDRVVLNSRSVEFGIYSALLTATSVKERDIVCQFEREEWVDILGLGLPPRNQWLGGLSGAPLWTLTENTVFAWRLGGIIFNYSQDYELLYARRPDCIAPDGTLIKTYP